MSLSLYLLAICRSIYQSKNPKKYLIYLGWSCQGAQPSFGCWFRWMEKLGAWTQVTINNYLYVFCCLSVYPFFFFLNYGIILKTLLFFQEVLYLSFMIFLRLDLITWLKYQEDHLNLKSVFIYNSGTIKIKSKSVRFAMNRFASQWCPQAKWSDHDQVHICMV